MATEFKQRKIKEKSKKIPVSILLGLIFVIIVVILLQFNVFNRENNSENNSENEIVKNQSNNSYYDKNIIINNTIGVKTFIDKTNKEEKIVIDDYSNDDAIINGIVVEMDLYEVEKLLGTPQRQEVVIDENTGYEILRYYYHDDQTEINFKKLYNTNDYVVYSVKTRSKNSVLSRNIQIGDEINKIEEKYKLESIIYRDAELIIIGVPGENPFNSTSTNSRILFRTKDRQIVEVSISMGCEY